MTNRAPGASETRDDRGRTTRVDGLIRRVTPSLSMLTYRRWFKWLTGPPSYLYSKTSPFYRGLPPNHLRVRVGVGNDIVFNHPRYLVEGVNFWLGAMMQGWIQQDSNIVDIGVGCGRYAHVLRDLDFYGERYTGSYTGVDIDDELLAWCRGAFPSDRFRFIRSNQPSSSYIASGDGRVDVEFDLPTASQDLVFSRSLFSHLLEPEILAYVDESGRVLRPGGIMSMTFFSLDTPPPTFGSRHTFTHPIGRARVESLDQPTAAVAYHDHDLIDMAMSAGFSRATTTRNTTSWQQMLVATR